MSKAYRQISESAACLEFKASSLDYSGFLDAVKEHIAGIGCEPVITVDSAPDNAHGATVYFEGHLMKAIIRNPSHHKRFFNALRYGYIGRTRGGRNGIVSVNLDSDSHLTAKVLSFMDTDKGRELIGRRRISDPEPVKIVAHMMGGDRLVGFRDRTSGEVTLYDLLNYDH
jgi:hypothetical protein